MEWIDLPLEERPQLIMGTFPTQYASFDFLFPPTSLTLQISGSLRTLTRSSWTLRWTKLGTCQRMSALV